MAVRLAGGLHPTGVQEALLRVVVAPDACLEERWHALHPLDLDRIEHGVLALLPSVYLRLSKAGVDDPLLPRLKGAYRNVWYRNQLQVERAAEVLRTLGPDAIVIRDVALVASYYRDPGVRLARQIELIVSPGAPTDGNGTIVHVEAPRYLASPVRHQALLTAFRARAEERRVGTATARMLAAQDELLVICAAAATLTDASNVQWLLDIRQILRHGPLAEPDRFAADAEALGLLPQVGAALAYLASVDDELELVEVSGAVGRRRPSRRDRFAYRLSTTRPGPLGYFPRALGAGLRRTRSPRAAQFVAAHPARKEAAGGPT